MKLTVEIIRTDDTRETLDCDRAELFNILHREIAPTLDFVNLRDGRVMAVDDRGYETEAVEVEPPPGVDFAVENRCVRALKPENPEATRLYHAVCAPGATHKIVGDVAIFRDDDV